MYKIPKILFVIAFALTIVTATTAQTTNFTPVEGASLKAKIDNAIVKGKAGGRFWVGYQFEVRPGVAIDFEMSLAPLAKARVVAPKRPKAMTKECIVGLLFTLATSATVSVTGTATAFSRELERLFRLLRFRFDDLIFG